jgi:hypothetical protein
MLHSLLFNVCINIQTWILILSKLKLKYGFSYKDNISTCCAILHYLIHTLRMFWAVCCSIFLIFDLLFQGSHNITTMFLQMVSTILLIKLVECFVIL